MKAKEIVGLSLGGLLGVFLLVGIIGQMLAPYCQAYWPILGCQSNPKRTIQVIIQSPVASPWLKTETGVWGTGINDLRNLLKKEGRQLNEEKGQWVNQGEFLARSYSVPEVGWTDRVRIPLRAVYVGGVHVVALQYGDGTWWMVPLFYQKEVSADGNSALIIPIDVVGIHPTIPIVGEPDFISP